MGDAITFPDKLHRAIEEAGLLDQFDHRGQAQVDCPACGKEDGLRLTLHNGRAQCHGCGLDGPLVTYLREREQADIWAEEPCAPAEIIVFDPVRAQNAVARAASSVPLQKEEVTEAIIVEAKPKQRSGKVGERLIMTLLALLFLLAGLAAAGLSAFANYQAFSGSVSDPMQAQIWGWAGVIASVCSFGGFTFFWWHMSARRHSEGIRALVFALAGAATSIAGTAMFMENNAASEAATRAQAVSSRAVIEAQIEDWSRQVRAIPAETRSVGGLEAYLRGVEAAGRTHQKPYRDAQNELGLAKRRDDLEVQIAEARATLLGQGGIDVAVQAQQQNLPGWLFALMLEVFSSQGTSIAFVSLLLLYGRSQAEQTAQRPLEPVIV